jgi:CheY-like chemotaxis protein
MNGPEAKPDSALPGTALSQRLRLLVAEDNPTNVKLMRIVLRGLGFECDVVGTGREVLDALLARIDAVALAGRARRSTTG